MKVNFLTTTNTGNGYGMTREYFQEFLPLYGIELESPDAGNEYTLILHTPHSVQFAKGKTILYTMIEGDEVPDSWKEHLAKADHIIVPTIFVQETFKKSGFDSIVCPLGYDSKIFYPVEKRREHPFTFLHYEAFQDRKGWREVLDAWLLSGLAEQEYECQLVLKTIVSPFKVVEMMEDRFVPFNLKIVCGELSHFCLGEIVRDADCFVFPSHGEGFSLPPIEAMACGLPTIISVGHSHLDLYDEEFMYGVPAIKKIPARYSNWEDQGNFVRVSTEDLARSMKYIFENQEDAFLRGQKSLGFVKKYEYAKSMERLAGELKKILGKVS